MGFKWKPIVLIRSFFSFFLCFSEKLVTLIHTTTFLVDGKPVFGELNEVLHVPGIGPSLFSIGCATAAGMDVCFSDTKVALSVNQNTVIVGHRIVEALYHLQISANKRDDSANAAKLKMGTVLQRFAHLNCKDIVRMKRTDAVKDLGLEDGDLSFSCEACIFGKMHRTPFPTEGHDNRDVHFWN